MQSVLTPPPGGDTLIVPRGPKLDLQPLFDRIFVGDPDAGAEEPGMVGGIHLPPGQMNSIGYALLEVIAVGPDVKNIEKGNRVLVARPQVELVAFDGNKYWRTAAPAVIGVVK